MTRVVYKRGTTVCRWNPCIPYSYPRATWTILEPTGPQVRSYWAYGNGWAWASCHKVRIGAFDLITIPEYERAYQDYQNNKLLEMLKR